MFPPLKGCVGKGHWRKVRVQKTRLSIPTVKAIRSMDVTTDMSRQARTTVSCDQYDDVVMLVPTHDNPVVSIQRNKDIAPWQAVSCLVLQTTSLTTYLESVTHILQGQYSIDRYLFFARTDALSGHKIGLIHTLFQYWVQNIILLSRGVSVN